MKTIHTMIRGLVLLACCAGLLTGCSEDQSKKPQKTTLSAQEQRGKEAAEAIKQPINEAQKMADQVGAKADRALQEGGEEPNKGVQLPPPAPAPTQEPAKKKRLEGC